MAVDAVVLASGNSKKITTPRGTLNKALIEINGKPMLEYVIDTLKESSQVEKVVVVIPPSTPHGFWAKKVDKVVGGEGSLTDNLLSGVKSLQADKQILVLSSDIPLITPEAINDFLHRCRLKRGQIFYPIISRDDIERQFPRAKRTYVVLKDGVFTGGNVVLLSSQVVKDNIGLIERAFQLRQKPIKLARILGLKFILKFIFRRLTLSEIENRVSALVGAKSCAIVTPYPEIGVDVDKDSDLELAKKALNN